MIVRVLVISLFLVLGGGGVVYGSANRLTAQSAPSTGLGGACIAQLTGPDAAYWNPANMADLPQGQGVEIDVHYIYVPAQSYSDNRSSALSGESNRLNAFRPTFFYTSQSYDDLRFGISLTTPFGLSREWDDPYPATFAEEYSLTVFELNPVMSYRVNDVLSVGVGVRGVYGQAEVKSDGVNLLTGERFRREMDGDALEAGYNLALTVKPLTAVRLGLTYRSKVTLKLDGDADLYTSASVPGTPNTYTGSGSVDYPLPAVLALGVAYSFPEFTLELTWDRTYWSAYDELDFEYGASLDNPYLAGAFDSPIAKDWRDTDAFHLGVTYTGVEQWIFRAGITIDETPVPGRTLGFEMADSDLVNYSAGVQYSLSSQTDVSLAYIYTDKDDRKVQNSTMDGTFTNTEAHSVTLGLLYSF